MSEPAADSAAVAPRSPAEALAAVVVAQLGERVTPVPSRTGEVTFEVKPGDLLAVARALRDGEGLKFEQCVDVCGMDYLQHGIEEWKTHSATSSGFSRGVTRLAYVEPGTVSDASAGARRFAAVYHLLSVALNQRVRLRVFCEDPEQPIIDSVTSIWASADWFEREAFDLFGIMFKGHPDLRRLLTDYGFIGHPFRKDFPISGNVEVRYDPEKGRVVYQPVSIEPRVLVPKVVRSDNRYAAALKDAKPNG
jgi:NADH-quinone oxidoreductase subunit C